MVRHSLWHPASPGCRYPNLLALQGYGGVTYAFSYPSIGLTVAFDGCTITGNVAEQVNMRHSVMKRH